MSESNSSGGFGCIGIIVFVLTMWSLFFGLPTPWGTFHIDIFPPAIRIEDRVTGPVIPEGPAEEITSE